MTDLQKGYIVYFNYRNYHRDPFPMALVLYADTQIVHCINLHYLSTSMTNDIINMISLIVTKQLNGKNTYKLYHSYMKQNLGKVIKNAYRTYKPKHITNVVYISRGFHSMVSILNLMKTKTDKVELVKKHIQKDIEIVKQKTPEELQAIYGDVTYSDLLTKIDDYYSKIKSIIKPKINPLKFTGIRRKK